MADKDEIFTMDEKLIKMKREAEERDAQRRAAKAKREYLSPVKIPIEVEALKLISEEEARRLKVAPFQLKKPDAALAVYDPDDKATKQLIASLEKEQRLRLKIFVVSESTLEHVWSFYKYIVKIIPPITGRVDIERELFSKLLKELTDLDKVKKTIGEFDYKNLPTGQLLEIILAGALANRASDIHFEPGEKNIDLRYRIDGLLHTVIDNLASDAYPTLVSRIKLFSHMKLNITNEPQDGRFTIGVGTKEIEMRVSAIPSEFGETLVMRILDPEAILISLKDLGLRNDDYEILEKQIKEPNGMILNTGPTGSGKTTTLYASLNHVKRPEIKIITIEDPIEYHLEGIEQTQVDLEAGYDFANGLQSMMRQDPDVILVGEIRDAKTASIAIQAALTGHLVFSTVHANSAAGAIPRLVDLEVRPSSIGPALNLIIAQRLVRRLCDKCKVSKKITPEIEKNIKNFLGSLPERVDRKNYGETQLFESKGCQFCNGLGYKGRVAVMEMMEVGPEMEKFITENVGEAEIKEFAAKKGMVTMQQDGVLKAISGITTFEEVENLTGAIQW
ncbi:MAG: GspE/PulE family protein [Patescibacteria group bacterium]